MFNNTVRAYVYYLVRFINQYRDIDIDTLNKKDINTYLQFLISKNRSNSYINLAIIV